jgi:hypothetical protein
MGSGARDTWSRGASHAGPGGDVYRRGRLGSVLKRGLGRKHEAYETEQELQVGEVKPRAGACD